MTFLDANCVACTELSEAFAVRRLEALMELAKLRQTTVPDLMRQLDIRPRHV